MTHLRAARPSESHRQYEITFTACGRASLQGPHLTDNPAFATCRSCKRTKLSKQGGVIETTARAINTEVLAMNNLNDALANLERTNDGSGIPPCQCCVETVSENRAKPFTIPGSYGSGPRTCYDGLSPYDCKDGCFDY